MGDKVSKGGVLAAAGLCLAATIGAMLSHGMMIDDYDGVWLTAFLGSLITLSGAIVDFDPKRLIK